MHNSRTSQISSRTSGAQPGNKNAQKHGFYSQLYSLEEHERLGDSTPLEAEQGLLRTLVFRIGRHLRFDALTPAELSGMFHLLLAVQHINTLERTLQLARGRGGELGQTILDALKEMNPDEDLG